MRKPKASAKSPIVVILSSNKKVYVRQDVIEWMAKYYLEEAVKSFRAERHQWIEEILREDDDIDIRFENELTEMNVKNIKNFVDIFVTNMNHTVDGYKKEMLDGRK